MKPNARVEGFCTADSLIAWMLGKRIEPIARSQPWYCPDCRYEGDCLCECGETLTEKQAKYDHLCDQCSYLAAKC